MKTAIIDGRARSAKLLSSLKGVVEHLKNLYKVTPKLAVVLVGDNPQSRIYVRNKLLRAREVGIDAEVLHFQPSCSLSALLSSLEKLNADPLVHGIIVQSPLPEGLDFQAASCAVNSEKDVDGFNPINAGRLSTNARFGFIPCTALACLDLIKTCKKNLSGLVAVVIGRSNIVGRPLAQLLVNNNATVILCHRHTLNLKALSCLGDIVILATGQAEYFDRSYFKYGSVVIDVGINQAKGRIVGDAKFSDLLGHVSCVSQVPGGVGPMTVAYLLINTVKSACLSLNDQTYLSLYE